MKKTFRQLRVPVSQVFSWGLVAVILFSSSAWKGTAPLVGDLLFTVGVFLVAIASFGRLWCSLYIGGFKTEKLITAGPYSLCRNPLYLFSFIGIIGMGLVTEMLFFAVIFAGAFALYYPLVISAEEENLRNKNPKEFAAYIAATPRFFPRFSQLYEPDSYTVNPKVFRNDLVQALWFVWAIGIIKFIEGLHTVHIIPDLFRFY